MWRHDGRWANPGRTCWWRDERGLQPRRQNAGIWREEQADYPLGSYGEQATRAHIGGTQRVRRGGGLQSGWKDPCIAGADSRVILWDVASGRRSAHHWPAKRTDTVLAVAFSPDGSCSLRGTGSTGFRLWDVVSGQSIASGAKPARLGDRRRLQPPDGRTLAAGIGSIVQLWTVATRVQRDGSLDPNSSLSPCGLELPRVESLAFSPDGSGVISRSVDGAVVVWDLAG